MAKLKTPRTITELIRILKMGVTYQQQYNKQQFHSKGRQLLQRIANDMGLKTGTYEVRSNLGGIAVSGGVTLHGESIYIQISQPATGNDNYQVLYRTCNGRTDYCGGRNNFCSLIQLKEDYENFINRFAGIAGIKQPALVE